MSHPLVLAAGTALDADPPEQIAAAAAAGFSFCGLRLNPAAVTPSDVAGWRRSADCEGVAVFDVEVVRLATGSPTAAELRLLDIAADLGARWVLTVSHVEDPDARLRGLTALARAAQRRGVGIALEFMAFTAVSDLAAAVACQQDVDEPCGVLVDALHLARTGGSADDVARMPAGALAYVQLCDASTEVAPVGAAALAVEARHHRVLPGAGVLDLAALAAAGPPDIPFSVEVQNDALAARTTPAQRAVLAYAAGSAFGAR